MLNEDQSELAYNMKIAPPGPYVLILEYVTPVNTDISVTYDNTTATDYSSPKGILKSIFNSSPL